MAHWVGAQGKMYLPKIQKHALIVTSPSENPKLRRTKKVLTCSLRLAETVKGLNSSLAQSAGDLWL